MSLLFNILQNQYLKRGMPGFIIASLSFLILAGRTTIETNHPKEIAAKHYVQADRAYKKGKIKKAIVHLKRAIDLESTNENYINKLANISGRCTKKYL